MIDSSRCGSLGGAHSSSPQFIWSIGISQLFHVFYSAWDSTALGACCIYKCTSSGSALGSTYSPHTVQIPYTVIDTAITYLLISCAIALTGHVYTHYIPQVHLWKGICLFSTLLVLFHGEVAGTCTYVHIHVIVVSWFLQGMGFVPCEGCMYFRGRYYPMHCKKHETADLYYKANHQISFARMSLL